MPQVTRSPNSNRFCIPAALSALTGLHVDKVIELIKEEIGEQPIAGILYPLALKILKQLGFTFREIPFPHQMKDYTLRDGRLFLICQPHHVGVIEGKLYFDNSFPQGTENPPRMRITKIFEVWKETK